MPNKWKNLAGFLPWVKRLNTAVDTLEAQVAALTSEQQRMAEEVSRLKATTSALEVLSKERDRSPEPAHAAEHAEAAVTLFVPSGHFYSPVVDPAELRRQGFDAQRKSDRLCGIDMDLTAMEVLFGNLVTACGKYTLHPEKDPGFRYYYRNGMFPLDDAVILAGVLRHFRPQRWIEVGSGFSSAVLLDTLDRTPDLSTRLTFVEPNPARLDDLLRGSDRDRVTIIQSGVQAVPIETFEALEAGDVLFLDTTHVAKTGSDVNHEFFQIMPRLASGVIIHLHDVFADFEYPEDWIYRENRSWNEQYVLRAFLMYNRDFEVLFFKDLFVRERRALVEKLCPVLLSNAGGGLWMRKR